MQLTANQILAIADALEYVTEDLYYSYDAQPELYEALDIFSKQKELILQAEYK